MAAVPITVPAFSVRLAVSALLSLTLTLASPLQHVRLQFGKHPQHHVIQDHLNRLDRGTGTRDMPSHYLPSSEQSSISMDAQGALIDTSNFQVNTHTKHRMGDVWDLDGLSLRHNEDSSQHSRPSIVVDNVFQSRQTEKQIDPLIKSDGLVPVPRVSPSNIISLPKAGQNGISTTGRSWQSQDGASLTKQSTPSRLLTPPQFSLPMFESDFEQNSKQFENSVQSKMKTGRINPLIKIAPIPDSGLENQPLNVANHRRVRDVSYPSLFETTNSFEPDYQYLDYPEDIAIDENYDQIATKFQNHDSMSYDLTKKALMSILQSLSIFLSPDVSSEEPYHKSSLSSMDRIWEIARRLSDLTRASASTQDNKESMDQDQFTENDSESPTKLTFADVLQGSYPEGWSQPEKRHMVRPGQAEIYTSSYGANRGENKGDERRRTDLMRSSNLGSGREVPSVRRYSQSEVYTPGYGAGRGGIRRLSQSEAYGPYFGAGSVGSGNVRLITDQMNGRNLHGEFRGRTSATDRHMPSQNDEKSDTETEKDKAPPSTGQKTSDLTSQKSTHLTGQHTNNESANKQKAQNRKARLRNKAFRNKCNRYRNSIKAVKVKDLSPGIECTIGADGLKPLSCASDRSICLSDDQVCDGQPNCPGGEDEQFSTCAIKHFAVSWLKRFAAQLTRKS